MLKTLGKLSHLYLHIFRVINFLTLEISWLMVTIHIDMKWERPMIWSIWCNDVWESLSQPTQAGLEWQRPSVKHQWPLVTIGQQASVNSKVRKFPSRGDEVVFEKKIKISFSLTLSSYFKRADKGNRQEKVWAIPWLEK